MSSLPVFFGEERVGTVEGRDGGACFAYDPAWLSHPAAFAISLQMPLSTARTKPGVFERWAADLLPEGARLRALAQHLGKDPADCIGILAEVGGDTAGALSFGKSHAGGTQRSADLDPAALERILDSLAKRPLLAGDAGMSMTLGGARPKLAVAVDDLGRISVPRGGAPSTHILKPDSPHLFGGVQNEALCLTLARRCGLAAPAATTGKAGNCSYLLVQRYDRAAAGGGQWRRLHQENLAQALGTVAGDEPALADVLALARRVMPAPGVLGLIDQFILHVLVCNPDVRAGSFALLLSPGGVSLAPLHGVASMAAWDGASRKLERMLAGEHMDWRHWEHIAESCGLNAARLLARAENLVRAVLAEAREAAATVAQMAAGPHPLLPRLVEAIEARARRHLAIAEGYRRSGRRKARRGGRGQAPRLAVVSSSGGASA